MITVFWKHSYTVQNNTVTEKIDDSRISEIKIPESDSKNEPKDDSYLDPANAVADIDTFFIDEGLEVNLL